MRSRIVGAATIPDFVQKYLPPLPTRTIETAVIRCTSLSALESVPTTILYSRSGLSFIKSQVLEFIFPKRADSVERDNYGRNLDQKSREKQNPSSKLRGNNNPSPHTFIFSFEFSISAYDKNGAQSQAQYKRGYLLKKE